MRHGKDRNQNDNSPNPALLCPFPHASFTAGYKNHKADLKESVANFCKCTSLLSVPCFLLLQRNDNLQASNVGIFFHVIQRRQLTGYYLPPTLRVPGAGVPSWASSSHKAGTVPVCRTLGSRQAAGRANSESMGGKRRATAMENVPMGCKEYAALGFCFWGCKSASARLIDAFIPSSPAACPLAIGSFLAAS